MKIHLMISVLLFPVLVFGVAWSRVQDPAKVFKRSEYGRLKSKIERLEDSENVNIFFSTSKSKHDESLSEARKKAEETFTGSSKRKPTLIYSFSASEGTFGIFADEKMRERLGADWLSKKEAQLKTDRSGGSPFTRLNAEFRDLAQQFRATVPKDRLTPPSHMTPAPQSTRWWLWVSIAIGIVIVAGGAFLLGRRSGRKGP